MTLTLSPSVTVETDSILSGSTFPLQSIHGVRGGGLVVFLWPVTVNVAY